MFKLSAYSQKICEIIEKVLSRYKLEYKTIYNPRGDFKTYFIYTDNEELRKRVIKTLVMYAKLEEKKKERLS